MENLHAQIMNYFLTQSWQIGVLVLVVAAVTLAMKNSSAHVRYLLWLIVLAKCLVPPMLTITLAVLPEKKAAEPVAVAPVEVPPVTVEAVDVTPMEPGTLHRAVIVAQSPAKPSILKRLTEVTLQQWLMLTWIFGVGVFVLAAVIKALRVNRWLRRERKPLSAELQTAVENLFRDLGVRSVPKVWLVEGTGQPFVWGLLRGSIYLPANFTQLDSDESRRGVLGHEVSHILRFDAAVNLLQIIAQAIFWFHPFVWWANNKIRAEREKCCDEMAIARLGARAKDYSRAIVNTLIAEHKAALPVPSLAVAGPVKNIEDRIKTIMRPGRRFYRRPSLIVAITVFVLALIAVPTTLALTAREAKSSEKMDVETLLAKVRHAQVPTQNMVMEWDGEIFVPIPTKRKYKAAVSGDRVRLEYIQEAYKRRIGGEAYNIRQEIRVFDGKQERELERQIKQKYPVRPLIGRVRKSSYVSFMRFLRRLAFGCGLALNAPELRKTFNKIELHDSNTPGIYLLDAISPSGERHRLTIDGNRGYHIVKKESFDNDKAGNKKASEVNVSLKKRSNGLWYPVSWEMVRFSPEDGGKGLIVERDAIKRVKFNAEIPDETFNVEFAPGTAVWNDKLREYVAVSEPGTIDLLTLLAKMRAAIRPAETMRVHWTRGELASPGGVRGAASNLVWRVKDFTALVGGSRSRVDWLQKMYQKKTAETPFYIRKTTSVFDGYDRRELTEEVENGRTTYTGTISAGYNNDGWLLVAMHGLPNELSNVVNYKEAAKGIDLKVTGSPRPGVYTLDAFVYWIEVLNKTGGQHWQLTIDGNRGFNPVRAVLYEDDGSILQETNITLRKYPGDIWYPARAERVRSSGGKVTDRKSIEIKAEFGIEVPENAFKLEFPHGTKVRDIFTGKEIVIGEGGEQELWQRLESAKKLQTLASALLRCTNNDEKRRLPGTLKELRKGDYVNDKDLQWFLKNVEYLGKGRTAANAPDSPIAYDKTLLQKGKETNVLFLDGHVAFERPEQLEKLGI